MGVKGGFSTCPRNPVLRLSLDRSQPDARAPAVLVHEDYACFLQRQPNYRHGCLTRLGGCALKLADRDHPYTGSVRELHLRPVKKSASGSTL